MILTCNVALNLWNLCYFDTLMVGVLLALWCLMVGVYMIKLMHGFMAKVISVGMFAKWSFRACFDIGFNQTCLVELWPFGPKFGMHIYWMLESFING